MFLFNGVCFFVLFVFCSCAIVCVFYFNRETSFVCVYLVCAFVCGSAAFVVLVTLANPSSPAKVCQKELAFLRLEREARWLKDELTKAKSDGKLLAEDKALMGTNAQTEHMLWHCIVWHFLDLNHCTTLVLHSLILAAYRGYADENG